jgi:capsid protein
MLWNGASLIEAELKSAVAGAAGPAVLIKTRSAAADMATQIGVAQSTDTGLAGTGATLPGVGLQLPSGGVAALFPDEDVVTVANNRPSQQILPFLKGIWGTVAAALHVGRRWMDRDYSDANYTSLRADQFDSRRLLEPEQHALGRFLAMAPYRRMAPLLAAQAGRPLPRQPMAREKSLRAVLQPDGWQYVDPEKDVRADVAAITAGLDTFTAACARRGSSFRDVLRQLAKDRKAIAAAGITVDLSGTNAPAPDSTVTAASSSPSDPNADPTPTPASGSGLDGESPS